MKLGFGTYALMVSVLFYGILLGGIAYSHIVFFPPYLSHLPESASLVNGDYALHDEYFWTTIHPLAILALIVALAANWRDGFRRKMIAMPLAAYLLAMIVTFMYFVPELREFRSSQQSSVSAAEWKERGERWQHLSWVRGGTLTILSIPLLLALAKRKDEVS